MMAMQEKKLQILEAAIHCFARKGFHATSIQEIADELGMAKGSIYFYVKSKDDLLISVFEYYGEMLTSRIEGPPEEWGLPPREKLSLQLERQFRFFREHLDFMSMLYKEPLTGLHPQIQQIMHRFRARSKVWSISHLIAIYGASVERDLGDASALLSGMMGQYFEAILIDKAVFDERRLSLFLVSRLDDLLSGIQRAGEEPILRSPDLKELRKLAGIWQEASAEAVGLLQQMVERVTASESDWDDLTRSDLSAALNILLEEAANPRQRNQLLLRGMIALLKQQGVEEWQEPLLQLEKNLIRK